MRSACVGCLFLTVGVYHWLILIWVMHLLKHLLKLPYPTAYKVEMIFLTCYDSLPLVCYTGEKFHFSPKPSSNPITWLTQWPCFLSHRWILIISQRTSQWRTWRNLPQAALMWPRKESMPWWKRIHCLALCALGFIRSSSSSNVVGLWESSWQLFPPQ